MEPGPATNTVEVETEHAAGAGRLEEVSCGACGSRKRVSNRELSGYRFHSCIECGLVYMSPRPLSSALTRLYDERYFASGDPAVGYPAYAGDASSLREKALRLMRGIERHGGKGALLDVGCAYGFTLEVARARGFRVEGVEPAAGVAERVNRELGVPVHRELFAAKLPDSSFDVVTMWDVIEHLSEPRKVLGEVSRILRPGGLFSVVTPDVGSLAAKLLGDRWEEKRKMPEHIYFFDRKSLARLLRSSGFDVIEWGTVGKLMSVREAAQRMGPALPKALRPLCRWLESSFLAARVLYLDPRWKLSVLARRRA